MNIPRLALQSLISLSLLLPVAAQADKFSIVVIPDTQMYVEAHPEIFEAQMDWVVANKAIENIIYVAHLGDLKDDLDCDVNIITAGTGASRTEWEIVDDALTKLDDANIPFGIVPGNHDYDSINNNQTEGCPNFTTQRPLVEYNTILGPTRFAGKPYYGDPGIRSGNRLVATNSNEDNFALLEGACGVKLIAINLGYHQEASPASDLPEVDWADELLKAYPDRLGILTSHYFIDENPAVGANGARNQYSSYGQQVRDRLVDNPNLLMMLSAHERGESWNIDTAGRTGMQPIHALLSDYQSVNFPSVDGDPNTPPNEPNPAGIDFTALSGSNKFGDGGFMRIMRFDTDTGTVNIETFIPPVIPIKNRPATIVSTHFPASGAEMDRNTASNFGFSFLGYGSDPGVCPVVGNQVTLQFEDNPAPESGEITFAQAGITTFVESGFGITPDDTSQAFFLDDTQKTITSRLLNPTGDYIFYQNQTQLFTISSTTGAPFALVGFDSGAMFSVTSAELIVTGQLASGGTVTETINLVGLDSTGNAFVTYTFGPEWSNLSSVDFTRASGNFVGFDNIILAPGAP